MPADLSADFCLDPWPYPFWIAHRGAGKTAPENTLVAFREGARAGFGMFECDVKLSKDGVLYLLHDDALDRTTHGSGLAGALTWAELSQLDAGSWLDPRYAGEPPASLMAVWRYLCAQGLAVNFEIKPDPGQAEATGRALAEFVWQRRQDLSRYPLLSSFEQEALKAAQLTAPALPRALLLDAVDETGQWLADAQSLGCVAVVFHYSLLTEQRVALVHQAGLRVLAYTVNEIEMAERLRQWGLDGVITDRLDIRAC